MTPGETVPTPWPPLAAPPKEMKPRTSLAEPRQSRPICFSGMKIMYVLEISLSQLLLNNYDDQLCKSKTKLMFKTALVLSSCNHTICFTLLFLREVLTLIFLDSPAPLPFLLRSISTEVRLPQVCRT